MRLGRWKHLISWTVLGTMLPGCSGTKNVHYLGDAELKYYKNYVQAIEYPNVDQATPPEVVISDRPRTVKDRTEDEIWDLTLMDAIHAAIANNKLIRTRSQFLTQSALLTNPANSPSIYDPALRKRASCSAAGGSRPPSPTSTPKSTRPPSGVARKTSRIRSSSAPTRPRARRSCRRRRRSGRGSRRTSPTGACSRSTITGITSAPTSRRFSSLPHTTATCRLSTAIPCSPGPGPSSPASPARSPAASGGSPGSPRGC